MAGARQGSAAAADAPAGPSPVPPAPAAVTQQQQQQQPQELAHSSSSSSAASTAPQQQQVPQQVQQQVAPLQQRPPRPTLQQYLQRLRQEVESSAGGKGVPEAFNLKEALRWVSGFAPVAYQQLDEHFDQYFDYIKDKQGVDVLVCVVFYCIGHWATFKGGCPAVGCVVCKGAD